MPAIGAIASFIPSIIGAGTSIAGGVIGSNAAGSAASQQQAGAAQVAQLAQGTTAQAQQGISNAEGTLGQLQAPYLAAGTQGVNALASGFAPGGTLAQAFTPPDPNSISGTPEYQFQLNQGTQALDRSAAARGEALGGGQMKAITQYGQGLASTAYQQAYNNALNTFQTNHNNTLNGLLALSGIGQNATNTYGGQVLTGAVDQGQFGFQGLNTQAGAITGAANAGAQGTLNSANSWNQALGGISNSVTGNILLNKIGGLAPTSGYGTYSPNVGNGGPPIPNADGTFGALAG